MYKHLLLFIIIILLITACTSQATSTASSSSTSPTSSGSSFPQRINTPSLYMDALLTGELVVINGCLRVKDNYGNSILLIWRPGFSTRTEQGIIQVLDGTGQAVASVGDYVEVGGGFDDDPTWMGLREPLPKDCPGPYWVVGESIKKIERPPSHGSSFPQLINTPGGYLDALITGELVITNGCLRVNDTYGESVLLIWPPGFSTHPEQESIQVLDSTGKRVASVGDWVEVGGGEVPTPTYLGLIDPLPKNCPGPYWLVGEYIKKIDYP